jgi:hypothetical protein
MTDGEPPAFGAAEVITITSKFEADDDAFIIGGQATNFGRGSTRMPPQRTSSSRDPFTSKDIDYFGSQEVARHVAAALGGELLLPAKDDHTPSTAQVVTAINGKPLKIDFLGAVLGIRDRELRRGVSVLEVEGDLDGRPATVLIKVLHPVQCLKSRIISMLHPATRRTDRIARTQAEAALVIVRCFINDALDSADGWRDARDCLRTLYPYLRSDEYVKVADVELGIDVVTILRTFAHDERIDARYRVLQLKKMIANIEKRRTCRR